MLDIENDYIITIMMAISKRPEVEPCVLQKQLMILNVMTREL